MIPIPQAAGAHYSRAVPFLHVTRAFQPGEDRVGEKEKLVIDPKRVRAYLKAPPDCVGRTELRLTDNTRIFVQESIAQLQTMLQTSH